MYRSYFCGISIDIILLPHCGTDPTFPRWWQCGRSNLAVASVLPTTMAAVPGRSPQRQRGCVQRTNVVNNKPAIWEWFLYMFIAPILWWNWGWFIFVLVTLTNRPGDYRILCGIIVIIRAFFFEIIGYSKKIQYEHNSLEVIILTFILGQPTVHLVHH